MNLSLIYAVILLAAVIVLGVAAFYVHARWRQAERDKKIQQILLNLSRALASNFSREAVLQGLAHSLSEVIKVSRIGLVLFEDQEALLYGVYDEWGKSPPPLPYRLDLERYPELLKVLSSSQVLYIREVATDPLFARVKELIGLTGIASLLLVPLSHQGRVFGALTLAQHGRLREFSTEEIELCEAVAASGAIALANRELFEELKHTAQEIKQKNEELLASYKKISADSKELQKSYQELQEAQQKLVDQEKLNVVMELAYAAAHEINSPLAALSLILEMMRDKFSLEAELKQKVEKALEQTYRVAEIIKKISQLKSYHTTEYTQGLKMIDLDKSISQD